MVKKSHHETTGAHLDAFTWTYESQSFKAETYLDHQATWPGHGLSY